MGAESGRELTLNEETNGKGLTRVTRTSSTKPYEMASPNSHVVSVENGQSTEFHHKRVILRTSKGHQGH